MKTGKVLLFLALVTLLFFSGAVTMALCKEVHVGISAQAFPTVNKNDAQAAIKVWAQTATREQGIQATYDVHLIDSFADLRRSLDEQWFDFAAVTAREFLQLDLQSDTVYLAATEDGFQVRYVLVVHRKSGISAPEELKNLRVAIPSGNYMQLAGTWFDAYFQKHLHTSASSWPVKVTRPENISKALLEVFFRQVDAAVLTIGALRVAGELNPQVEKNLVIIGESVPLIPSLIFFRPSWRTPLRDVLDEAFLNLHTMPQGKQVLTLFLCSHMEKHPAAVLEPTLSFLRQYKSMTKKK